MNNRLDAVDAALSLNVSIAHDFRDWIIDDVRERAAADPTFGPSDVGPLVQRRLERYRAHGAKQCVVAAADVDLAPDEAAYSDVRPAAVSAETPASQTFDCIRPAQVNL